MKIREIKQEYQLQEWSGMVREQKASGLTIKAWCHERGIPEHIYYYRLRKLRQAACNALEDVQSVQLAEIPLAPNTETSRAKLRLTTKGGTLEMMDVEGAVLEQILRVMMNAE